MFFSHVAMQSNYLFQWMKPSLKVMIYLQVVDRVCQGTGQEKSV